MNDVISQRICLCGDGWGALAALDGLCLEFHQVVVVSNDDAVIDVARSRGLDIASSIFEADCDTYVCAGFTTILDKGFLDANRVLNIHYSLLPKYRGIHSTVWALLNNEQYFGLTMHLMNEFIDDGPIVYQHKFENIGQNAREVMELCNEHIATNLSQILKDFLISKIKATPQDKSKATWVCKRNLEDCLIDFEKSVDHLALLFRALVEPYPLPRIKTNKYVIDIVNAELSKCNYEMTNGRVVNIEGERVWIKVMDGFLIVNEIRESQAKAPLSIGDVFKIGMRLG